MSRLLDCRGRKDPVANTPSKQACNVSGLSLLPLPVTTNHNGLGWVVLFWPIYERRHSPALLPPPFFVGSNNLKFMFYHSHSTRYKFPLLFHVGNMDFRILANAMSQCTASVLGNIINLHEEGCTQGQLRAHGMTTQEVYAGNVLRLLTLAQYTTFFGSSSSMLAAFYSLSFFFSLPRRRFSLQLVNCLLIQAHNIHEVSTVILLR